MDDLVNFEVVQLLGAGASAVVFLLKHRLRDEYRVAKICKAEIFGDTLESEHDMLQKLRHEHVIQAYGFVKEAPFDRKICACPMEDCFCWDLVPEDGTCKMCGHADSDHKEAPVSMLFEEFGFSHVYLLVDQIPKGPQREMVVRFFFRQLIEGIRFCHDANQLAHRDIKTDNLVLGSNLKLRLIDFNCAESWAECDIMLFGFVGTPRYAAPEVFRAAAEMSVYDAASADLWSCGVVLYELLAGPFQNAPENPDSTDPDALVATFNDQVEQNPFLSAEAKNLLKCLLHADPEERKNFSDQPWYTTEDTHLTDDIQQLVLDTLSQVGTKESVKGASTFMENVCKLNTARTRSVSTRGVMGKGVMSLPPATEKVVDFLPSPLSFTIRQSLGDAARRVLDALARVGATHFLGTSGNSLVVKKGTGKQLIVMTLTLESSTVDESPVTNVVITKIKGSIVEISSFAAELKQAISVHAVSCTVCGTGPIIGSLYISTTTPEPMFFCSKCAETGIPSSPSYDPSTDILLRVHKPIQDIERTLASIPKPLLPRIPLGEEKIQTDIVCDLCKKEQFPGPRYNFIGINLDLCETCFHASTGVLSSMMLKISKPAKDPTLKALKHGISALKSAIKFEF